MDGASATKVRSIVHGALLGLRGCFDTARGSSMTSPISLGRDPILKLRQLLAARYPSAYCDSCLAIELAVSLPDAKAAARAVRGERGFIRQRHKCDGCGGITEVTSMRKETEG